MLLNITDHALPSSRKHYDFASSVNELMEGSKRPRPVLATQLFLGAEPFLEVLPETQHPIAKEEPTEGALRPPEHRTQKPRYLAASLLGLCSPFYNPLSTPYTHSVFRIP